MTRFVPLGFLSTALAALGFSAALAAQTPDLASLKLDAAREVDQRARLVQEMVDMIFSFGELGFQEYETSRYVTAILEKNGFKIERGVAGIPTAWIATWGSGKPVVGFITDIDGIPRASQKPGVAYHAPIIEGAPGHGEGHNSGMAVNVAAVLALKDLMTRHKIAGTLRLYPGIAEELLGTKAFYVRAGLFKGVDLMLGCHVNDELSTTYGQSFAPMGLVSVEYTFHGQAAHAAGAPWRGRSALDGVELMNAAWNYKREHLRPAQRSHYVITNGGDQPNVVPSEASVWYFFREMDYAHLKEMVEFGDSMAKGAAIQTGTQFTKRTLGSAWPPHFSKVVAEVQQKNIEAVGVPTWTEDDQKLAKALQTEIGVNPASGLKISAQPLQAPQGQESAGSDDVGDISWNLPMVYLSYPANIPGLPGHHWANAVAMATPIAHKGSVTGAKVQAMTALDFLTRPKLVEDAWKYFREVQTINQQYTPLIDPADQPATFLNKEKMERFRPEMRKYYYDPARYKTYLEQLGIQYPTVR